MSIGEADDRPRLRALKVTPADSTGAVSVG